jgi:hypothetical protein
MAAGFATLAPELDDLRQQFEAIARDGETLVAPLTDAQFTWQPTPDAWSVAQCVDHLNATARAYLPKLDAAIADATGRGLYGSGPFRYSAIGRWMTRAQGPPATFKVRAPKTFRPGVSRSRSEIMAAFAASQEEFVERLRRANGLDLGRARVSSPPFPWLRFSLGSGFTLMAAHERRHLWQASNVIAHPRFPR